MVRTQSTPDECYMDRNLAIQLLALSLKNTGITIFYTYDHTTPGYKVIFFEIAGRQLAWHIPENELFHDFTFSESGWQKLDVINRKDAIIDILRANTIGF